MRFVRAILIGLLVVTPVAAEASSKPKAPRGKYKFDTLGTGGFKVTKKKKVESFTITPTAGEVPAGCPTTAIKVKGKLRLQTDTNGGYTTWIFGKHYLNDPKPRKVTFVIAGAKVAGKMRMIFDYGRPKYGDASLEFGDCSIDRAHFTKSK